MTDSQQADNAKPAGRSFDPDALRERYRIEREKRLRKDGSSQYVKPAGAFGTYTEDPHAQPNYSRAPLKIETSVLIVGGGFGGLLAAAHLKKLGISDVRIIDKASDFGGTWYWNRYPGAACDTESYIYLPLLEDLGYLPSEKYAKGPEILENAKALGRHFELYDKALFQTEVTEMHWQEDQARWRVSTSRGDIITSQFVISVIGSLHQLKLPAITGMETFKGHTFHTSRWDYGYTGGDANGNLNRLADKRVGVIGTGATAVQCVPHLAASAKQLYVFQRTPSVVDERNNRPTDHQWAKTLKPGWQRERQRNFDLIVSGGNAEEDLVKDGWTDLLGKFLIIGDPEKQKEATSNANLMELADFEKMEKVRGRVDAIVKDPATRELLKPYYSLFCKRPCFHDEYLQTFNLPNVSLVDTKGKGVERLTPDGAVVDGIEYQLDCIVYATGFEFNTLYTRRAGFEVYGRGGQSLTDKWIQGPKTLHGFHTHGFPNFFVIAQLQGGGAANFTHMLDEQAEHVALVIGECRDKDLAEVEVEQGAEDEWVETILELGQRSAKYHETCTPGYYNNEGQLTSAARRYGAYAGGPVAFLALLEEWRKAGDMPGLRKVVNAARAERFEEK